MLAAVKVGRGLAVLCQVHPGLFKDGWQRGKALRVLSTLLTNMGAARRAAVAVGSAGVAEPFKALAPLYPESMFSYTWQGKAHVFNPDRNAQW